MDKLHSKGSTLTNETPYEIRGKKTDNLDKQRFAKMLQSWIDLVKKTKSKIAEYELKISSPESERHAEVYARQLADAKRSLRIQSQFVEFMRFPYPKEDVEYRLRILSEFAKKVKDLVPDNLPLVFHGTSNIGTVREIIKTNGLFTPEQKGESAGSTANAVDVTTKANIQVSCDFAEPGISSYMPYGAIFVFFPKDEEIAAVNASFKSTQVMGGVDGVNFKQEPNRLYGIITTPENITRIQEWCEQYGLDKSKVLTHSDFLEQMIKKQSSS